MYKETWITFKQTDSRNERVGHFWHVEKRWMCRSLLTWTWITFKQTHPRDERVGHFWHVKKRWMCRSLLTWTWITSKQTHQRDEWVGHFWHVKRDVKHVKKETQLRKETRVQVTYIHTIWHAYFICTKETLYIRLFYMYKRNPVHLVSRYLRAQPHVQKRPIHTSLFNEQKRPCTYVYFICTKETLYIFFLGIFARSPMYKRDPYIRIFSMNKRDFVHIFPRYLRAQPLQGSWTMKKTSIWMSLFYVQKRPCIFFV